MEVSFVASRLGRDRKGSATSICDETRDIQYPAKQDFGHFRPMGKVGTKIELAVQEIVEGNSYLA